MKVSLLLCAEGHSSSLYAQRESVKFRFCVDQVARETPVWLASQSCAHRHRSQCCAPRKRPPRSPMEHQFVTHSACLGAARLFHFLLSMTLVMTSNILVRGKVARTPDATVEFQGS